jgi:hypothetical protein
LFKKQIVPPSVTPHRLENPITMHTGGGTTQLTEGIRLTVSQIRFPELSATRSYGVKVEALLSPHTAKYDVILGHDVMVPARMALCFETRTIKWGELVRAVEEHGIGFYQLLTDSLYMSGDQRVDSFAAQLTTEKILSSKNEETDTQKSGSLARALDAEAEGTTGGYTAGAHNLVQREARMLPS